MIRRFSGALIAFLIALNVSAGSRLNEISYSLGPRVYKNEKILTVSGEYPDF